MSITVVFTKSESRHPLPLKRHEATLRAVPIGIYRFSVPSALVEISISEMGTIHHWSLMIEALYEICLFTRSHRKLVASRSFHDVGSLGPRNTPF